jgi:hypothetical protein
VFSSGRFFCTGAFPGREFFAFARRLFVGAFTVVGAFTGCVGTSVDGGVATWTGSGRLTGSRLS